MRKSEKVKKIIFDDVFLYLNLERQDPKPASQIRIRISIRCHVREGGASIYFD
jgi:hypothetical protein